jgi:hypothetical protein
MSRSLNARSSHWTVISSREVLGASPFLKVRVETVELPDIPALSGGGRDSSATVRRTCGAPAVVIRRIPVAGDLGTGAPVSARSNHNRPDSPRRSAGLSSAANDLALRRG